MTGERSEPPPDPEAYFSHVAATIGGEWSRRLRRALLIATGAGLLAVFALGASILPAGLSAAATYDLRVGYLVFLGAYGLALGYLLLRATGGPYGDALWTAEVSRVGTQAEWRRVTGEQRIPASRPAAVAWLAEHPETEGNAPQRLMVQIYAGDSAAARDTLSRYPRETPFQRYWHAADAWFLDVLEGRLPPLDAVAAEAAAVDDPAQRAHAASGLAVLRAHHELLSGRDWVPPLAAARPLVEGYLDETQRLRLVVRVWTTYMAIAAAMIGAALLVAVVTGLAR